MSRLFDLFHEFQFNLENWDTYALTPSQPKLDENIRKYVYAIRFALAKMPQVDWLILRTVDYGAV